MKITLLVIGILVILWIIAIQFQRSRRIPVANELINDKIKLLKSTAFEKLVALIGKGYVQDNLVKDGITYYIGYVVSRPNVIGGLHTNVSKEVVSGIKPEEVVSEVEINGYVDCITIIPFIYFKIGPAFKVIINNKGEIVTPQKL